MTATRSDDMAHDAEVMRDEEVGQAELVLQILEQIDDLRLHGDVERRDRLVGDDQLGLHRQCTGDADALALPAGELVRETVVVLGAASRRGRAAPAPGASARRPCARPCSSSGSPTIWPTRLRGLSEANGSWKIICISRRSGRRSRRDRPTSSPPSNSHRAGRRLVSCRIARHSVDLPQPDSPTSPSVSPSLEREADAVDGAHPVRPRGRRRSPLDREVLDEVGHLQQRIAASHYTLAPSRGAAAVVAASRAASSQQRSRCPLAGARSRAAEARRSASKHMCAARREAAARRQGRAATAALPGSAPAARSAVGRAGRANRAGPRCRGVAGA